MHAPTPSGMVAGIDDMTFYVPGLFLPIETLAKARNLDYEKLNKGLGLTAMALPDVHEDAATMAANAVYQLLEQNQLSPHQIGRIYLGTESGLDGSKPLASYVLEMLEQKYQDRFGPDCFLNCDVVDLTFACIGAVDALENTLEWVSGGPERMGIVVASDWAKYELESTGEYTQGAGAVAMLVKQDPRLLAIEKAWGVASRGVHDFYKPIRKVTKGQLIEEVLNLAQVDGITVQQLLEALEHKLDGNGVLQNPDEEIFLHKETPVFDGPYSNRCYRVRLREAFENFLDKALRHGQWAAHHTIFDRWERLFCHLPYAYQGKRMFSEVYLMELERMRNASDFLEANGIVLPEKSSFEQAEAYEDAFEEKLRLITKTHAYNDFANRTIEKSQRASSLVGNIYTGSLFLALMSTLEIDWEEGYELADHQIGFFAYGSGSKSKVFEATIQPAWKEVVARFQLFHTLANRQAVDYDTYEKRHRGLLDKSIATPAGTFALTHVEAEENRIGARHYAWFAAPALTYS